MSNSTVFITSRGQIIPLPEDMRFPPFVKRVTIRARGVERIITPAENTWDSFFLGSNGVPEDFLSRASQKLIDQEDL